MYDGIDKMDRMVAGLTNQQKAISNNIANAHTPGYTRQTYSFSDVLGNMSNPYENRLSQRMGAMIDTSLGEDGGEPVDLAREMVDMQKVYLNYSMVTRRMSTVFGNLRRATQLGR